MLQDTDKMPYGKFQGVRMADVPADYLLWLYEQNMNPSDVRDYIEDNLQVLNKETGKNVQKKNYRE